MIYKRNYLIPWMRICIYFASCYMNSTKLKIFSSSSNSLSNKVIDFFYNISRKIILTLYITTNSLQNIKNLIKKSQETIILCNKVCFTKKFYNISSASIIVSLNKTLICLSVSLFTCLCNSFFSKDFLSELQITICLYKSIFTITKWSKSSISQLFY